MLTITNIANETHNLTNVKTLVRRRAVNGERKIGFLVAPGLKNEHAWESVDAETTTTFKGDPYIFKGLDEASKGNASIKKMEAVHTFFNTMINCFQYEVFTGSQTFFAALTRVFEPTPYDFSIVDTFYSERFENFGMDNCLALFENVLGRYGAEFKLIGNRVYLHDEIGEQTNFQYRWKHNVKSLDKSVSTQGLSNVIRGYGGKPDDNGNYPIEIEHRSPNEHLFPTMDYHAEPYFNENITTQAGMRDALIKKLMDEPQLSIKVDVTDLNVQNEGDRGFIIYEPMNITVSARVVELIETFEFINKEWVLVKREATLSNIKDKLSDVNARFAQTSKRIDRLLEGKEGLPYNVLPEAMRIAAEAINNSLTEIQYPPGQGIILQDPNNPNLMIRLTSAGIGLSEDGGQTYRTALTGAGIVTNELVAGIIRTNNIQIVGENDLFYWNGEGLFAYNPNDLTKYVRLNSDGLYIAKGAMTIERPDGYIVMNNGLLQNDFSLQPTVPSFRNEQTVGKQGVYLTTNSTTPQVMEAFFFAHKSRYLKLLIVIHDVGGGQGSRLSVNRVGGGGGLLGQAVTYGETDATATPNSITLNIDLGVPTGDRMGIYVNLNTTTGGEARGRIVAIWCDQ
ncbi:prophage endopeptidase tail family protein [Planococcus dechangensis]